MLKFRYCIQRIDLVRIWRHVVASCYAREAMTQYTLTAQLKRALMFRGIGDQHFLVIKLLLSSENHNRIRASEAPGAYDRSILIFSAESVEATHPPLHFELRRVRPSLFCRSCRFGCEGRAHSSPGSSSLRSRPPSPSEVAKGQRRTGRLLRRSRPPGVFCVGG